MRCFSSLLYRPEVVGLCEEVRYAFSDILMYLLPAMIIVLISLQLGHLLVGELEVKDIKVLLDACRRHRFRQRIEALEE